MGKKVYGYLSNRVHLEKLRSFVGDTHLKIWNLLNLDTDIFSGNQCLVSIFVSLVSVKGLQTEETITQNE
jgi:hypothetical protein